MSETIAGRPVVTTGRPLDDHGDPTDGPALELDPADRPAELLAESSGPLVSSPGAGTWATLLAHPDEDSAERPELLQWLGPDASEMPPHVHPTTETFRTVEGALTVVVAGEERRLGPGESLTVQPGEEHAFRNDTGAVVAFRARLPSMRTVRTLHTVWGMDHEGRFDRDGGYGEPGPLHGLLLAEALAGETRLTVAPHAVQRALWATVGRVARTLGYRAVDERYLADSFWERQVEQPRLLDDPDRRG